MLLSYVILALSASFAHLASAAPTDLVALGKNVAEPGTLLGRHYSVQDRRLARSSLPADTTASDNANTNAARRLVPYAKYLADRSDDVWLHVRERRADDPEDVNYLSDVSTYSAPRPFGPPTPPPAPVHRLLLPTLRPSLHPRTSPTLPQMASSPSPGRARRPNTRLRRRRRQRRSLARRGRRRRRVSLRPECPNQPVAAGHYIDLHHSIVRL
ncbi:hypothetical protein BV20DRAFT_794097 [Pilatotrama ljubarskyi]|nr:hypothetical protein BV20DRAFT_794097 [Pilatotrama ljubarskyi]